MKDNLHFFTGFPGFLTTQVIARLFEQFPQDKIIALVEKRAFESAKKKVSENNWTDKIELIVGDITKHNLGIEDATLVKIDIQKDINYLWHLAAIYDLAVPEEVAHHVNVVGTQKVVNFCATLSNLKQFNYISTAYVSGRRAGRIFEDELDEGQEFNNFYESTKFLAEKVVQKSKLPYVIFRPAVIVGDSKFGITEKFDGPYYLFKLLNELPKWMPSVNINTGSGGVNIVPIDFASDALVALGTDLNSVHQIFHICDPNPMSPTEIIELSFKYLGKKPPVMNVPKSIFKLAAESEKIEKLIGVPRQVLNYFNHNANYDCSNSAPALEAYGIICPHLSSYVSVLIDYYETNSKA